MDVHDAYPARGDGVYVNRRFHITSSKGTSTPLTFRAFHLNDDLSNVYTIDGRLFVITPKGTREGTK